MTPFLEFLEIDIDTLSNVGIYSIQHVDKPDGLYIGSTSKCKSDRKVTHHGFYKRFYDHCYSLKKNKHHSKYLQNVVNKYGIEGLKFSILEICNDHSIQEIFEKEQHWIDSLKPIYNMNSSVFPKGRVWTEEEKRKQHDKMKGKPLPEAAYNQIKKEINQYSKTGLFIKTFESKAEASRILKIDASSISNCANGKRKTAGGFIWKYVNPKEAKELNFSLNRLENEQ